MRALDTNVLVRLITRDDAEQAAAADEFIGKGGWVSHVVLVEAVWVLSSVYNLDAARITRAIDMLLNHKDLTLQEADVVAAALGHFRRKPSLGFSDCLVLEICRKAGHLPLGTFDRGLSKLEGTRRL